MTQPFNRLRELDFLRGLAIILVLFRHRYLFQVTKNMGWIGVDLFFVLSGFLVSGLLFKEYKKYGTIEPGRFLIRRGFKIYPVYYTFYLLYLIPIIMQHEFELKGFLADMVFIQNYVLGFGYAFGASWSLAVEEHFYFGLVFLIWFGLKKGLINPDNQNSKYKISTTEIFIITLMILCLALRISNNLMYPSELDRNFTMTHLRIDSLLAGVLISYLFYFRQPLLEEIYARFKWHLLTTAVLFLSFTPFINPIPSFYAKTIGFTMLYIAFGSLLVIFLMKKNINETLDRIFSKTVVNLISRIGFCSYSIYIIHPFINRVFGKITIENHYLDFFATSAASIVCGMLMTYYFENHFLRIRDKYFPARTAQ